MLQMAVGCDVSTVSRVLNGRPNRVSGENRSRIREAAHRLGYVANRTASSLASGATRTVGLLIPNVFDGVYAEYIETLDLELSAAATPCALHMPQPAREGKYGAVAAAAPRG